VSVMSQLQKQTQTILSDFAPEQWIKIVKIIGFNGYKIYFKMICLTLIKRCP
jgi:hypothetical protein